MRMASALIGRPSARINLGAGLDPPPPRARDSNPLGKSFSSARNRWLGGIYAPQHTNTRHDSSALHHLPWPARSNACSLRRHVILLANDRADVSAAVYHF